MGRLSFFFLTFYPPVQVRLNCASFCVKWQRHSECAQFPQKCFSMLLRKHGFCGVAHELSSFLILLIPGSHFVRCAPHCPSPRVLPSVVSALLIPHLPQFAPPYCTEPARATGPLAPAQPIALPHAGDGKAAPHHPVAPALRAPGNASRRSRSVPARATATQAGPPARCAVERGSLHQSHTDPRVTHTPKLTIGMRMRRMN